MAQSLRVNVQWTLAGNIGYAASQWIVLIMLAKFTDAVAVGQFVLALAISSPIFAFTNLQMRSIEATDTKQEIDFSTYLSFRVFASLAALLLTTIIAVATRGDLKEVAVIVLVATAKLIESVSDVIYGFLQKHEEMRKISLSMMVKSVCSIALVGLGLLLFESVVAAALGLALAWLTLLIVYDFRSALTLSRLHHVSGGLKVRWNGTSFRNLFWVALPMGIVMLLNSLNINIPRYFVENLLGQAALGYYASIAYLIVIGATVVNAVGQTIMPRLARYFREDKKAYQTLIAKAFMLAMVIGLLSIAISAWQGELILEMMYTKEYAEYVNVLVWTMIGGTALYCSAMLGVAVTAARSYGTQAVLGTFVTLSILLSAALLVPRFGLTGAALCLAVGYAVKLIVQGLQVIYLVKSENDQM